MNHNKKSVVTIDGIWNVSGSINFDFQIDGDDVSEIVHLFKRSERFQRIYEAASRRASFRSRSDDIDQLMTFLNDLKLEISQLGGQNNFSFVDLRPIPTFLPANMSRINMILSGQFQWIIADDLSCYLIGNISNLLTLPEALIEINQIGHLDPTKANLLRDRLMSGLECKVT